MGNWYDPTESGNNLRCVLVSEKSAALIGNGKKRNEAGAVAVEENGVENRDHAVAVHVETQVIVRRGLQIGVEQRRIECTGIFSVPGSVAVEIKIGGNAGRIGGIGAIGELIFIA